MESSIDDASRRDGTSKPDEERGIPTPPPSPPPPTSCLSRLCSRRCLTATVVGSTVLVALAVLATVVWVVVDETPVDALTQPVAGALSKPTLTSDPANGKVDINTHATLTCTPNANDASRVAAYSWQKDGVTDLAEETAPNLVFTAFAASDAGDYTCKTVNGSDKSPASNTVTLSVKATTGTALPTNIPTPNPITNPTTIPTTTTPTPTPETTTENNTTTAILAAAGGVVVLLLVGYGIYKYDKERKEEVEEKQRKALEKLERLDKYRKKDSKKDAEMNSYYASVVDSIGSLEIEMESLKKMKTKGANINKIPGKKESKLSSLGSMMFGKGAEKNKKSEMTLLSSISSMMFGQPKEQPAKVKHMDSLAQVRGRSPGRKGGKRVKHNQSASLLSAKESARTVASASSVKTDKTDSTLAFAIALKDM